jgi:hypothetical protein
MRYHEFANTLNEAPDITGAAKSIAPTLISKALEKFGAHPIIMKIANVSPGAGQAVTQLLSGNITAGVISGIQVAIPEIGALPAELKTLNNFLGYIQTLSSTVGSIGGAGATAAAVPIGMLASPFVLAGEEQKKIDADPWNKKYDNNPYAMSVRSGGKITQGQAAAQNQRNAVRTSSTAGNPMPGTPEFEKLQQQYAK